MSLLKKSSPLDPKKIQKSKDRKMGKNLRDMYREKRAKAKKNPKKQEYLSHEFGGHHPGKAEAIKRAKKSGERW